VFIVPTPSAEKPRNCCFHTLNALSVGDPCVCMRGHGPWNLWMSGYLSAADSMGDEASRNPLLSDTDFTFNISTDSNADADLPRQLLAHSVIKQELRIKM